MRGWHLPLEERDSALLYNRFCFAFRFLQDNEISHIEDGTFAHLMNNLLQL